MPCSSSGSTAAARCRWCSSSSSAARAITGGSAPPLVQLLVQRGEGDQAAAIARLVLAREECPDADEIEQCLDDIDEATDEWRAQLEAMGAEPPVERVAEM